MTDPRPSIRFDSTEGAPGERFERYRELYSRGTDAVELGPHFHATMTATALDRSTVFDRRLADVGHERTAARCRRDAFDHFTLTLTLSGEFHADSGQGFQRIAPGETVLMDMTRPMRNRARQAHIITMAIARERLAAVLGARVDRLHGHRIEADSGFLLADHLQSLIRHAAKLQGTMLIPLSRISADMLVTAMGDDAVGTELLERRTRILRLDQINTFIEQAIDDPALDADTIAARFGISRATLYRAFQPQGGLARAIRRRRLALLRARLSDSHDQVPIAELALDAGFGSEAIASEAFMAEYGIRPGLYRRQARRETELERTYRKMAEWVANLR